VVEEKDAQSLEETRMKSWGCIVGVILLCCVAVSCAKKGTGPAQNTLYLNSFESAEDTTGWRGITDKMFVPDPAPGAGARSLCIGGGCIQPAAYIDLLAQSGPGDYVVSFWGKVPQMTRPGRIVLRIAREGGEGKVMELPVGSQEWTFHKSRESLRCAENCALRLELWIGGFAPAHMFVDCIKIERVK